MRKNRLSKQVTLRSSWTNIIILNPINILPKATQSEFYYSPLKKLTIFAINKESQENVLKIGYIFSNYDLYGDRKKSRGRTLENI